MAIRFSDIKRGENIIEINQHLQKDGLPLLEGGFTAHLSDETIAKIHEDLPKFFCVANHEK